MHDPKPERTNPSNEPRSGKSGSAHRGWWIFFLVLVTPAILTFLTAKSENLWPVFAVPGSGVAGLYCGFAVSFRVCKTTIEKVIVGLALAPLFAVGSFVLCCVGCSVGGATLNIH